MKELINASPTKRTLKVRYAYYDQGVQNQYPVIRIAGKYLRSFGFEIGRRFKVSLSKGRLIIDLIPERKSESTTFSHPPE